MQGLGAASHDNETHEACLLRRSQALLAEPVALVVPAVVLLVVAAVVVLVVVVALVALVANCAARQRVAVKYGHTVVVRAEQRPAWRFWEVARGGGKAWSMCMSCRHRQQQA